MGKACQMDWTTLLASVPGSVDEERLRRNQQPAAHGHGRGCRVGARLVMDAAGFRHTLDIIGHRGLARAEAPPATWPLSWTSSQRGEVGRGEAQAGEKTRGTPSALCPPPNLPPREEASETVCSPTLIAFLIVDNVYCAQGGMQGQVYPFS